MLNLRLKTLMSQRGISTNKICEDLKISKTNFNRYKNNECQRWEIDNLEKMLAYFDCNLSDLVGCTESFRGIKAKCNLSEEDQSNIFADQLYGLIADLERVENRMTMYSKKKKDDRLDDLSGRLYEAIEEIQSIADALNPDDE